MTITKLADIAGKTHPMLSGGVGTITLTAPAVAVGNTVLAFGYMHANAGAGVTSITDARGNSYRIRNSGGGGTVGIFLADTIVTTALVAGDLISIVRAADYLYTVLGAVYGPLYFDTLSQNTWPSTSKAADGGPIATRQSNELVLGVFGSDDNKQSNYPMIVTPGAGYTDQPGKGFYSAGGPALLDEPAQYAIGPGIGCDWESKIGAGWGAERATATLNVASQSAGAGMTAAYAEYPINAMMVIG
jgi:hypothetical protein